MKKAKLIFIICFSLMLLIGCKSEQKTKPDVNPNLIQPEMRLSQEDTTQVRRLTRQFFDRLQQKDLGGALSMLNYYEHDSIKPLPPQLLAKEQLVYSMFLGMPSYDIDHIIFFRDNDSEVKFTVTMFDKVDPKDPRPNKASFMIRPVRNGGQWYLTLADTQTDKVKSEIKH